jgi:hypothetical protein
MYRSSSNSIGASAPAMAASMTEALSKPLSG